MIEEVIADAKEHMHKTLEALRRELATLRTGRASPALLEHIRVDYYGAPTPLVQLASTTVPEPRLLIVKPFDKNTTRDIERAILKSDLGLVPSSDGTLIRIPIPPLTEERRRELVKVSRKHGEEGRVAMRNIRRDAKEMLEQLEKDGEISEDDLHRALERLQKLTDESVAQLDRVLEGKEKEIMEV